MKAKSVINHHQRKSKYKKKSAENNQWRHENIENEAYANHRKRMCGAWHRNVSSERKVSMAKAYEKAAENQRWRGVTL